MKYFKYHINGRELSIKLDTSHATVAELLVDGKAPEVPADEMPVYTAVIALALIEHDVEVVHDEEPGVITLTHHRTPWARPAALQKPKVPAVEHGEQGLPQGEVF